MTAHTSTSDCDDDTQVLPNTASAAAAATGADAGPVVHVYPFSTPLDTLLTTTPENSNNSEQQEQHDAKTTRQTSSSYQTVKYVHWIRHAQGDHNVNKEYRDKRNLDARLTELGQQQCQQLANRIRERAAAAADGTDVDPLLRLLHETELIVTSPMTRCIQTTLLTMEPVLERNPTIPIVAHESIRETVNYNCDRRRSLTELQMEFEQHKVDFSSCHIHDEDPIWAAYEERVGTDDEYTKHRESGELHMVAERGRDFFQWLRHRPEQHIVVCSHAAFSRCLWNWGLDDDGTASSERFKSMLPPQHLDRRKGGDASNVPVVQYYYSNTNNGATFSSSSNNIDGEDDDDQHQRFSDSMRKCYDNCELRSMVLAFVDTQ